MPTPVDLDAESRLGRDCRGQARRAGRARLGNRFSTSETTSQASETTQFTSLGRQGGSKRPIRSWGSPVDLQDASLVVRVGRYVVYEKSISKWHGLAPYPPMLPQPIRPGIGPQEPNTASLSLSRFLLGPLGLRRIVDQFEHVAGCDLQSPAKCLDVRERRMVRKAGADLLQRRLGDAGYLGKLAVRHALARAPPVRFHRVSELNRQHGFRLQELKYRHLELLA